MTHHTVKTHKEEAERIFKGDQRFFIRSVRNHYFIGDKLTFMLVNNERTVFHKVGTRTYEVTMVLDHDEAPIEKGYRFVAFKEVA